MELEEKDLTQSKDISKKIKAEPLKVYVATLQNVQIEAIGWDEEDAREHLHAWLNQYLDKFECVDFKLKSNEAW